MTAAFAFFALTKAGRGAIWIDTPPTITPFRPADFFVEIVGQDFRQYTVIRAAIRAVIPARPINVGELSMKWASAAWRARAGRAPWDLSGKLPTSKPFGGIVDDGRRLNADMLKLMTAAEIARVGEIEDMAARIGAESVAAWRARGDVKASVFTKDDVANILGVDQHLGRMISDAVRRAHPRPEWVEPPAPTRSAGAGPFAVLGIDPTRDMNVIRAAWKRVALATHPDTGGSNEAFRRAKAAYDAARSTVA